MDILESSGTLLERLPMDLFPIISHFIRQVDVTISSPISEEEVQWSLETYESLTLVHDIGGHVDAACSKRVYRRDLQSKEFVYRVTKDLSKGALLFAIWIGV